MANWCAIGMTLTLKDEETARQLYDTLVNAKDGRDLDFHGDKIFYGAEIRLSTQSREISIQADVSWALEREDMIRFVKWLRQFVPATQLTASVDYSEFSCYIFGKYNLRNGLLKDHYLEKTSRNPRIVKTKKHIPHIAMKSMQRSMPRMAN